MNVKNPAIAYKTENILSKQMEMKIAIAQCQNAAMCSVRFTEFHLELALDSSHIALNGFLSPLQMLYSSQVATQVLRRHRDSLLVDAGSCVVHVACETVHFECASQPFAVRLKRPLQALPAIKQSVPLLLHLLRVTSTYKQTRLA